MLLPGISRAMVSADSASSGGGGSGGGPAFLKDGTAFDLQVSPTNAEAEWSIGSGGSVSGTGLGGYTWLNTGAAGDYEIRATLLSGSLTSGATGIWQSLSSSRTWSKRRSGIGTSVVTLKMEVRAVATGLVVATATINLDVEVT